MIADPRIQHVVVLMLESRSFDHLLGFLRAEDSRIDGLTGFETNPLPGDAAGSARVTPDAAFSTAPGGGHQLLDVNLQLFGAWDPADDAKPDNQGFVASYTQVCDGNTSEGAKILRCFAPDRVPALATLAREFAVCDRWFSSVPGPTWPNRFFAHCATSDGVPQMGPRADQRCYQMPTLYESLESAGASWRIYYHDIPQALALSRLRRRANRRHFRRFEDAFHADAAAARLPTYTFIEPRYFDFFGACANDQHPPHDVRFGEALIADVYAALRQGPLWSRTLLVVLYDEHGGFFDHIPPPEAVNPDGKVSDDPRFEFRRLGVRVPAVLVSPYIPRGTLDSQRYEHASLAASARRWFGCEALTERDRAANPISTEGWLAVARQDAPAELPLHAGFAPAAGPIGEPQVRAALAAGEASPAPLSEFQRSLVAVANALETDPELRALAVARRIETEHDAAVHVRAQMRRLMHGDDDRA